MADDDWLCRLSDQLRREAFDKNGKRESIAADRLEALASVFPIAWEINDALGLAVDHVECTASMNLVQEFRDKLHELDPNFSLGAKS